MAKAQGLDTSSISRLDQTKISQYFGCNTFSERTMRERLQKDVYKAYRQALRRGDGALAGGGPQRGAGHEGMGPGAGLHPLHPLVPAHDRRHGREARRLHHLGRARHGHRALQRQPAHPGRARRQLLPLRRPAGHLRGPGLHGLGSGQPGLHHGGAPGQDPVHPHGLRGVPRRGPGPQGAAAPLHGRGVPPGPGGACSTSVSRPGAWWPSAVPSRSTSRWTWSWPSSGRT